MYNIKKLYTGGETGVLIVANLPSTVSNRHLPSPTGLIDEAYLPSPKNSINRIRAADNISHISAKKEVRFITKRYVILLSNENYYGHLGDVISPKEKHYRLIAFQFCHQTKMRKT